SQGSEGEQLVAHLFDQPNDEAVIGAMARRACPPGGTRPARVPDTWACRCSPRSTASTAPLLRHLVTQALRPEGADLRGVGRSRSRFDVGSGRFSPHPVP